MRSIVTETRDTRQEQLHARDACTYYCCVVGSATSLQYTARACSRSRSRSVLVLVVVVLVVVVLVGW